MKDRYYFAYGSNMNLEQMKYRCPAAEVVENVRLENYRLAFRGRAPGNGVATVLPEKGSYVEGVLWKITEACEKSLEDVYKRQVLIIGAGPTGICTLLSVMLKNPKRIIMCEKDEKRMHFIREHYPEVLTVSPEECFDFVQANSEHGGADVVLEVAGAESTFRLAWECARPNAIVTVVALYDKAQTLPLPDMYGKNLTFKTGGVDGCDCEETLRLIAEGKINTEPLITHTYPLSRIEEAYELFENKRNGVIKVAVEC